jgi:hypothetical protein
MAALSRCFRLRSVLAIGGECASCHLAGRLHYQVILPSEAARTLLLLRSLLLASGLLGSFLLGHGISSVNFGEAFRRVVTRVANTPPCYKAGSLIAERPLCASVSIASMLVIARLGHMPTHYSYFNFARMPAMLSQQVGLIFAIARESSIGNPENRAHYFLFHSRAIHFISRFILHRSSLIAFIHHGLRPPPICCSVK